MAVLNFQLTGNEDTMMRTAFPVGHDISSNHLVRAKDLKRGKDAFDGFKHYNMPAAKVMKLATMYANEVVIPPEGFERTIVPSDKGTEDSNNYPDPGCRYSIRITDEQKDILTRVADTHFHGVKTYAIVWALRNFSALVASDPSVLTPTRSSRRLNDANSRKLNIRLPVEVMSYYDSIRGDKSLGKVVREVLVAHHRDAVSDTTPQTLTSDESLDDFLKDF